MNSVEFDSEPIEIPWVSWSICSTQCHKDRQALKLPKQLSASQKKNCATCRDRRVSGASHSAEGPNPQLPGVSIA